tara:strand:- start:3907 stop:4098 length:192 start_codon:yes stop_codon:yes gene_type:complete
MLAKAPKVNYEVFLTNHGYTCAGASTLEQAIKIAKNTGFQCNIFKSNDPFTILKSVCPIGGIR